MSFLACEAVLRLAFAEIANSRCGSKRREEALEAALEAVTAFRELGEQRLEVGERMGRAETHGSQRKHSSCVALWQGWALIALAHTHVQKGKGQVSIYPWSTMADEHHPARAGTKSEVPEELTKALEAAAQAQVVFREVGDRVGGAFTSNGWLSAAYVEETMVVSQVKERPCTPPPSLERLISESAFLHHSSGNWKKTLHPTLPLGSPVFTSVLDTH